MKRLALGLIALLGSGALTLWLLTLSPSEPPPALQAPTGVQRDSNRPETTAALSPALQSQEPDTERTAAPLRGAAQVAGDVPSPVELTTLEGKLKVIGLDGREMSDVDASFKLGVWRKGRHSSRRVEVRGGSWSVEVENYESIDQFSTMQVFLERGPFPVYSGLSLRIHEPRYKWDPPENFAVTLTAKMRPVRVLHIVDAVSRSDLPHVRVMHATKETRFETEHPGIDFEAGLTADALSSPIVLDPVLKARSIQNAPEIFVGAPGYTWKRVAIRAPSNKKWIVSLARGGDLAVHVSGVDSETHAQLLVKSTKGGKLLAHSLLEFDRTYRFEGLPPGELRASAVIAPRTLNALVLAENTATVSAGAQTTLALELQAPPLIHTAPAAGVVYVAKAWEVSKCPLHLRYLDTPLGDLPVSISVATSSIQSLTEGYDAYEWSVAELLTGAYEIGFPTYADSYRIEIPPSGRTDLVHTIAAPVDALIRCHDSVTGQSVRGIHVFWRPYQANQEKRRGGRTVSFDEEREGYAFRPPARSILIQVGWGSDDYALHEEVIDLSAASGRIDVNLVPWARVTLTLSTAGSPLPTDSNWPFSLRPTTHRHFIVSESGMGFPNETLATPGSYVLEIPKLDGFKEPDPLSIHLGPGEVKELHVELERE